MAAEYILVVDDEPDIRQLVSEILDDEGYQVDSAESAQQAREKWSQRKPDLVLLDIWMPDEDGISLLKSWQEAGSLCCPVIMMSGHATIETAVEATRLGAYDFIEKPLSMAKMLLTIENGLRTGQLEHENKDLRNQVSLITDPIGSSKTMVNLRENAERLAETSTAIMVHGESGSGKELIARYIHRHSDCKDKPFVKVALSPQNDEMTAKKLFGYEENGNVHYGLLDEANGGFLYLIDIYRLDEETQLLLLNTLKSGRYMRVNGNTSIEMNVRLVVSVTHDLRDDIEAGRFNEELYYKLSAVPIGIPALREHPEDIPELLNYYVDIFTEREGLPYRHFDVSAQNYLRNHPWKGNIRELRNLVQRLLILGTEIDISQEETEEAIGAYIPVYDEGVGKLPASMYDLPLRQAREQFEHDYLSWQLTQTKGNVSRLAEVVKMERTHLYRKMHALGIDPKKYNKN
ncbi:MAG TPA: sigma-54-dependent Fis family transcriptional regulator [Thiothrix sp.]|nr:sigma-54-dependent Fis family transcriptional regulator [Thiothrix sp.]